MEQTTMIADGRVRRRHNNMNRALDALYELGAEGRANAGLDAICERSGVSMRSLMRYFPSREELLVAAVERQVARSSSLYAVPQPATGPLDARITAYVDQRLRLHRDMAAVASFTRSAPPSMRRLAGVLRARRAALEAMVRAQFAPELDRMPASRRERTALAIHVLCQHESMDSLLVEKRLSRDQAAGVLESGVSALLA